MKQRKLHIPAAFQLMGQTFTVRLSDAPRNHEGKLVNAVIFHGGSNQVVVRSAEAVDAPLVTRQQQERLFLHEVIHGILKVTGHGNLGHDEQLVDALAYGLHQALTMQSDDEAR